VAFFALLLFALFAPLASFAPLGGLLRQLALELLDQGNVDPKEQGEQLFADPT